MKFGVVESSSCVPPHPPHAASEHWCSVRCLSGPEFREDKKEATTGSFSTGVQCSHTVLLAENWKRQYNKVDRPIHYKASSITFSWHTEEPSETQSPCSWGWKQFGRGWIILRDYVLTDCKDGGTMKIGEILWLLDINLRATHSSTTAQTVPDDLDERRWAGVDLKRSHRVRQWNWTPKVRTFAQHYKAWLESSWLPLRRTEGCDSN